MPRPPRLDIANVPQYVIQRGNDRQPCFFREIDCIRFLQDLREAALKYGCQIHAYVLMTNHLHLLVTPRETGAVSRLMQSVARTLCSLHQRHAGAHRHARKPGSVWYFSGPTLKKDR